MYIGSVEYGVWVLLSRQVCFFYALVYVLSSSLLYCASSSFLTTTVTYEMVSLEELFVEPFTQKHTEVTGDYYCATDFSRYNDRDRRPKMLSIWNPRNELIYPYERSDPWGFMRKISSPYFYSKATIRDAWGGDVYSPVVDIRFFRLGPDYRHSCRFFDSYAECNCSFRYIPNFVLKLKRYPPPANTEVVFTTSPGDGSRADSIGDMPFDAQLSDWDVRVINIWWKDAFYKSKEYKKLSFFEKCFTPMYEYRYYLLAVGVMYGMYKYASHNHVGWMTERLCIRKELMDKIKATTEKYDWMEGVIQATKKGLEVAGVDREMAFSNIDLIKTQLVDLNLQLSNNPEWDRLSTLRTSLLSGIFSFLKWTLLIKIVENYSLKFFGWKPLRPPKIVAKNDYDDYYFSKLSLLAPIPDNSDHNIQKPDPDYIRLDDPVIDAKFKRNRNIGSIAALAGVGVFYVGRWAMQKFLTHKLNQTV